MILPDGTLVFPWHFRPAQVAEGAMLTEWYELWLSTILPVRPPPTRDRLAGSLIGQCLGDALGVVVEGYSRQICEEYVEEILLTDKAGTIGRSPHSFGQYTDDSQLTRELVLSYIARRGFDAADYGRRIAALFSEQRVVGRGRATTEAAARLAQGVPWTLSGVPAPYAGNGAAMRAAPIGWIFSRNDDALVRTARDQARITHTDPRAVAGAVAIAGAVSLALRAMPGTLKPDRMIDRLARWVRPIEPGFATEIERLHTLRHRDPDDAVWLISRAGLRSGDAEVAGRWPSAEGTISPYVVPSVLWSLYSVLRSPDDYMQTIRIAISGGGDTDTTAAMAGAISGAYLGLDAIPRPLAERLEDCGTWGFRPLLSLVDSFYDVLTRS
ncbi:MAG: ADP-ribosylglycohydrolase family protein [Rhodospirillaceae bacterium]